MSPARKVFSQSNFFSFVFNDSEGWPQLDHLERGTENPTLDTLIRIADALEIEMWEMFDFGHAIGRKDLKSLLNKLSGEADEEDFTA